MGSPPGMHTCLRTALQWQWVMKTYVAFVLLLLYLLRCWPCCLVPAAQVQGYAEHGTRTHKGSAGLAQDAK